MGVLWQHNSCDVLVTYPIRGYYPRRAVCHGELNEHGSAVRDWEALCSLEPHNGDQAFGGSQNFWKYPRIGDYKEGLRKAKRAKADEDRKDYYSLLQVDMSWMCVFSSSCTTGKLWFCHQNKNPRWTRVPLWRRSRKLTERRRWVNNFVRYLKMQCLTRCGTTLTSMRMQVKTRKLSMRRSSKISPRHFLFWVTQNSGSMMPLSKALQLIKGWEMKKIPHTRSSGSMISFTAITSRPLFIKGKKWIGKIFCTEFHLWNYFEVEVWQCSRRRWGLGGWWGNMLLL